ncbi:MAG TPA: DUF2752 domain-containing protein, partial [Aquihabitans sp.]|nr:DUF2752 domain-containing protein [Aquihabitans sp.]
RAPLVAGALATAGTAALAVVDPTATHVPLCPLQALTGLDCPFCGSLRAVHALTRGDVGAALDHNVLFTAAVPVLVVGWALWAWRSVREPGARPPALPRPVVGLALALAVAFTVARNLPAFAWLASGT